MSDLERARAHLLKCQQILRIRREIGAEYVGDAEFSFCCALDAVWAEQQRDKRERRCSRATR